MFRLSEIKRVRKRLQTQKELEGIDTENIIEEGGRGSRRAAREAAAKVPRYTEASDSDENDEEDEGEEDEEESGDDEEDGEVFNSGNEGCRLEQKRFLFAQKEGGGREFSLWQFVAR